MRIGNDRLFKSRKYTTKIIQDGSYVELLQEFQPMLGAWRKEFDRFRLPQYIRHILSIEYEYVRIYVNSLSLQAVVERCTNNAGNHSNPTGTSGNGIAGVALSPETRDYYGKLPLARLGGFSAADQDYVKEVVDGSRNLLRTVVEGLLPGDFLKHSPVRTYFRIISGAMFLLKTFALGASKNDVEISIGLLDRAVDALRNCVVDGVHLGIRFADLLETLTSRLRSRFISAPAGLPRDDQNLRQNQSPVHHLKPQSKRGQTGDNIHEWTAATPNFNRADFNVSATPFDLNLPHTTSLVNPAISYHPNVGSGVACGGDSMQDVFGSAGDFWYLPAGTEFFQNITDQPVAQTAEGVNVGGMDLLDFMALDPPSAYGDDPAF